MNRLQPDVICLFGTFSLHAGLLRRSHLGILDFHTGLALDYRGSDYTFWVLYNNEVDKIGCALYFIDEGLDTGNLIAHIWPEVREGETEMSLACQSIKDSAEIYIEGLGQIEMSEPMG